MSVGIINIGLGNIGSLKAALERLGYDPTLVSKPSDLVGVTHLILPGVGSFKTAILRLKKNGLLNVIKNFSSEGSPILGICLGMQLLAYSGCEGGEVSGLELIPGKVIPINAPDVRLPHVGWNNVTKVMDHKLLNNIRSDVDFYFVHGYYFLVDSDSYILGTTNYGIEFPAVIAKNNVIGAQFHPEKSQDNGLRLLDNFCNWDGTC